MLRRGVCPKSSRVVCPACARGHVSPTVYQPQLLGFAQERRNLDRHDAAPQTSHPMGVQRLFGRRLDSLGSQALARLYIEVACRLPHGPGSKYKDVRIGIPHQQHRGRLVLVGCPLLWLTGCCLSRSLSLACGRSERRRLPGAARPAPHPRGVLFTRQLPGTAGGRRRRKRRRPQQPQQAAPPSLGGGEMSGQAPGGRSRAMVGATARDTHPHTYRCLAAAAHPAPSAGRRPALAQ